MEVIASAPGKVTLFGEHAVVYGKPAIVASIDKRVVVKCRPRSDKKITISALNLSIPGIILTIEREGEIRLETDYGKVLSAVSYIREAIRLTQEHIGINRGADITVSSEMPVGAGLGTSAAVAVSTIAAYSASHGYQLEKKDLARLSWETEKTVQGLASPMDSTIATYGGFIYLKYDGRDFDFESLEDVGDIPLIIGYTRRLYTTGEMVAKVKRLLDSYGEIGWSIVELIGGLVEEAKKMLLEGDLPRLGELMNINHGLLDALGVSTKELNNIVYVMRGFGAYGSKLSGAGGGGVAIGVAPTDKISDIVTALRMIDATPLETSIGGEGLVISSDHS